MNALRIALCAVALSVCSARDRGLADEPRGLPDSRVPELMEHLDAQAPPTSDDSQSTTDESWRLVRHNDAWWYWLPSNQWVAWNEVRWVAPRDLAPPGWNPLYYVPQFDRPYPGGTLWTATGPKPYTGDPRSACDPAVR